MRAGGAAWWKRLALVFLILLLAPAACRRDGLPDPTVTAAATARPTETPVVLPDLVIESLSLELRSPAPCANPGNPYGVRIQIANRGRAPSGPFWLVVNEERRNIDAGLLVDQQVSMWFQGVADQNVIWVDAGGQVVESDESNNKVTQTLAVPTTAPECQPTPTPVVNVEGPAFTLEGHTAKVWSVAFSPDGNLLASGSVDDTLRLWRVREGVLLRTMQGHPFPVLCVAFSPDGAILATGSSDSLIRLWRVSNGSLIRTLEGHSGWVRSLVFSPDGRILASAAEDFTVRLWRLADGELIRTVDEGMANVQSVAFHPDGAGLVWAEADGSVLSWRISDGAWLLDLNEPSTEPALPGVSATSIAISDSGDLLAAGYADGRVRVWNARDGSPVLTLSGHTQSVTSLAFAPDGLRLVSASLDHTLRLWRLDLAQSQPTSERIFVGHGGPVNSVAFSPNGQQVASGSDDGTLRLWTVPQD
jgi:WD40 repeat protein